ncbi:MAG: hypothetical protein IM526_02850 [Microcystis sp. M38BS1]|uniref:hypothetical protein n=1 Tax=Microcystis sp. M38BS1 TaxID=2771188 RepID=UPI0031FDDF54|nr:hypothetical protein [Microcystis sp. M38BS1]MCA6582600.1 hypothetical protein [Pseudanabaena sp. M34BS1SP1A06MG]
MSKKYTRNYNSTYATFLRSYQKAVAEFATQITVENDSEQPKYRRGVRASLAVGGIGAGYALGKNPEAQQLLKETGIDVKDRAIDSLQGLYDQRLQRAAEAKQVANDLGLNPSRWFGGQ